MGSDPNFFAGYHHDDPAALAEDLRAGLARGDFVSLLDRWRANRLLKMAESQVDAASHHTALGAALRQARAAEQTVFLSAIAIGISLVALAVAFAAYLKGP